MVGRGGSGDYGGGPDPRNPCKTVKRSLREA